MIIERLHLRDFGIYGGRHAFDLAPDPEGGKPIVLVEGHNGAGKTTFLEAIRLALYGKSALGTRVAQKAYDAYLRERLHRGSNNDGIEIALELRRREKGVERRYQITRSWQFKTNGVEEALSVVVDGSIASTSTADEWQDVLTDMVPHGVSQLFFFDGEKIQDIAQGDASAGLQQAIRPLLGLDIIEQLRTDLALFVARQGIGDGPRDLAESRAQAGKTGIGTHRSGGDKSSARLRTRPGKCSHAPGRSGLPQRRRTHGDRRRRGQTGAMQVRRGVSRAIDRVA